MARMKRVKNVERTFVFDLSQPGESQVKSNGLYIDTMQVHALVNRFATRQGMNVLIENLEIGVQPGGAFEATVLRLPQHWSCVNAWEKTMRHWIEQQNETAREAGLQSTRAAYRDFKIFFDQAHAQGGSGANLIPSGFTVTAPATGGYDWNPSQVVVPNDNGVAGNTQEYFLHMLGDDQIVANNSKGMIRAYAESRSRPFATDPNIVDAVSGGLFGEMEDVGEITPEIVNNMQEHNQQPPYVVDQDTADEYYPGGVNQGVGPVNPFGTTYPGQFVDIISVNASQNYNTDSTGSFAAPCGLIKLVLNATGVLPASPSDLGDAPFPLWCKVILAPGHYQGIAAVSMQEVN